MSHSGSSKADNSDELAPDVAMAISRARRAFGFSIGLLLLGLITIGFALVYRMGSQEETPKAEYTAGVLAVPAGAEIISAIPSEGRFAVTYTVSGKTRLRLIDGKTGSVIRDVDFVSE